MIPKLAKAVALLTLSATFSAAAFAKSEMKPPAPRPSAAPSPTWDGRVGAFHLVVGPEELVVRRGQGAGASVVLSLASEFAELTKRTEANVLESAAALVDTSTDGGEMLAEMSLSADVASWVGPLLTLTETLQGMTPGAAHPYAVASFRVVDLQSVATTPSLATYFEEAALLAALLDDKIVKRYVPSGKLPVSLDALLTAIDGAGDDDCQYRLTKDLLSHFAFLAVRDAGTPNAAVAVRLGMSHGCEAARGTFTQLGIWLPLKALKPGRKELATWLAAAATGKAGILLGGKARPRLPTMVLSWEKDLAGVVAAARPKASPAPGPSPKNAP